MSAPVKVFAPASVANVAVGYDILGFALESPGDQVLIKPGKERGLKVVEITGAKGKLPYDVNKNTAAFAASRLLKDLQLEDEPIEMSIFKKMPFGSGLGSSAASAAAGVYAVNEYLKTGLSKREILKYAVEGEQVADGAYHADNVAPSLLGGMILIRDNTSLDLKKLHIPHGLHIAVIHPEVKVLTKDSRGVLAEKVEFNKVIRQSGNLAAFVAAMYTSDMGLLSRSIDDLIVEPQRAHLIPHFYEMKNNALRVGAMGFSISGAGPAMFAFCENSLVAENVITEAIKLYSDKKIKINPIISQINNEGAFKY